jgi:ABC-type multidrug transport system fused ATPase/permease subunit
LYSSILKKSISWFDLRENNPGDLSLLLSNDVQTLNGISSEGISVVVETFFALLCGIILGFTFSWHLSLVCLGCVPFIWFSVVVNSKL